MGDKTFLILLIVFVVIGVFTYDQYITEKTGESPISKVLDYGGLAQEGQQGTPTRTTVSKFATFEESAEYNLNRLAKKLSEIQEQRDKLVHNRNVLLTQLIELKDKTLQEAELYAEEIRQEREEFLAYNQDLQDLGNMMVNTYNVNNLRLRQDNMDKIKAKIASLNGGRDWGVSESDINELLDYINSTVIQKDLVPMANCETTEQCLDANVQRAKLFLNEVLIDFQQEVQPRFVNAVKIKQKARRAYSDQMITGDTDENYVLEQDEYRKGQYRDLVQKMIQVTARDLNNLIQLYQELELEQKRVLGSVKINSDRLVEQHKKERQQMEALIQRIDKQKLSDFDSFFRIVKQNEELEDQYIQEILELDKRLLQLTRHRFFESKLFLKNISALIEVDIKRLVEDRNYAAMLNQNYLGYRHRLEERRRTVGIKDIYEGQKPDTFENYLAFTKSAEDKTKETTQKTIQSSQQTQEIRQPQELRPPQNQPANIGVEQKVIKPDLQRQKIRQENTLREFDRARERAQDSGF